MRVGLRLKANGPFGVSAGFPLQSPQRMLLTLNASCLRSQLTSPKGGTPSLALSDLPQYTREVLGLGGLNLTTDLLVGADRRRLEQLRERADRAGCPCLLLIESEPQKLTGDAQAAEASIQRMLRPHPVTTTPD